MVPRLDRVFLQCCHHDQGSHHDIFSFPSNSSLSQLLTFSNRSMLMPCQKKHHFLAEGPPKNGGGRKQHAQTSGARGLDLIGDDGLPGFPHRLVGQMK